jgi:hypothetical protein
MRRGIHSSVPSGTRGFNAAKPKAQEVSQENSSERLAEEQEAKTKKPEKIELQGGRDIDGDTAIPEDLFVDMLAHAKEVKSRGQHVLVGRSRTAGTQRLVRIDQVTTRRPSDSFRRASKE